MSFYLQMSKTKQKGKEDRVTMSSILSALNTIIGVIVVVYIGHKWSNYLQLLHENQMYFSAIKVCDISKSSFVSVLIGHPKISNLFIYEYPRFFRKWSGRYLFERNLDFIILISSIWLTQKVFLLENMSLQEIT